MKRMVAWRPASRESSVHVYLDTNIFHDNWHLDATNFRVLAHYLNNGAHTLFLSRLVIHPDGHPKLLHSWPPKLLRAGRGDYAGSVVMARRAAASLRR